VCRHCCSSSSSQVSGPSSEEPQTAPFVKEQQSRPARLLVVRSRRLARLSGTRVPQLMGI
jgi:hypothetical protein